jgi:hypothetical protein
MRFYSGDRDGKTHHHDIALVENRDLPAPPKETFRAWWRSTRARRQWPRTAPRPPG